MAYKYNDPPLQRGFSALLEGDYSFVVTELPEGEPQINPRSGNYVLKIKLSILPDGLTVYDNAWTGNDKNNDWHDNIASFLLCVNRAPKAGGDPDWRSVVGAKGRCHLKVETAQQGTLAGKEVN